MHSASSSVKLGHARSASPSSVDDMSFWPSPIPGCPVVTANGTWSDAAGSLASLQRCKWVELSQGKKLFFFNQIRIRDDSRSI